MHVYMGETIKKLMEGIFDVATI
ncbi:BH2736 [Halalkalibacterium halodurans C-125]|uniref:BH2736 protein n=1 Tax=Halalkalibacterium halodurans (strain ATCC BAA-125 / DSM 18197 / FERM 7344 / JCM 9153 / C-125) TaxID=272558 RepID=Q9K9B3_HALH5|nr:BH2736 [Halalkalibacterium halodurans C-125]